MDLIHSVADLRGRLQHEPNNVFVPTMGNLHAGHIQLIDIAKPRAQAPLRFLLERLQALNAISWVEEPGAFHLTAGPGAEPFMPIYEALVEDRRPLLRGG
jgi:hypothetical protein